jgi:uncharacterized protein
MKIAVIGGGGAGLTTAWLLEAQHDVTVFERLDRLGGHACTIPVERSGEVCAIDAGFEMFSNQAFPLFNRLLSLLDVLVHTFPMTITLEQPQTQRVSLIPPLRDGVSIWLALTPRTIWELLQFRYLLGRAVPLVQAADPLVTFEQFMHRLHLSRAFRERFLYPLLQGFWCLPLDEFLRFSAYDVLKLIVPHRVAGLSGARWNEVVGGTQTYIRMLAQSLARAQIRLATPISQITRESNHLAVLTEQGRRETFDHVILATSAADASRLLTTAAGCEELCQRLGKVEFFETKIAVHGDRRWMPRQQQHWSVVNMRASDQISAVTIWKPWRGQDLFRSWVTYAPDLPESLYALLTFRHPKPNQAYFATQAYLATVQGQHNLWFAGMYTQDVDLHESAILSAVQVARCLAPDSARLQRLHLTSSLSSNLL